MRNKDNVLDELKNAYDLLNEIINSQPSKSYITLLRKIKSAEGKPPVNLKLLDKKDYIDRKIKNLTEEILSIIGFE